MRKIFQGVTSDDQWDALGADSQLRPEMIHRDLFYRIACCCIKNNRLGNVYLL